jgi:hypothetical protein
MIQNEVDRRQSPRSTRHIFFPVSFESNGNTFEAVLVDISRTGAQFKIFDTKLHPDVVSDKEIEYAISTNLGSALCRAETRWSLDHDNHSIWGVEFTQISAESDDPLRRIIDALQVIDSQSHDYAG